MGELWGISCDLLGKHDYEMSRVYCKTSNKSIHQEWSVQMKLCHHSKHHWQSFVHVFLFCVWYKLKFKSKRWIIIKHHDIQHTVNSASSALPVQQLLALTHCGRMTHICIGNMTIIGSENGLLPGWCKAIIWTNAEILLIEHLRTNFSEILIKIYTFSFRRMHL